MSGPQRKLARLQRTIERERERVAKQVATAAKRDERAAALRASRVARPLGESGAPAWVREVDEPLKIDWEKLERLVIEGNQS